MEEARRNLLRTHTTAASARALYRLARQVGGAWGVQGGSAGPGGSGGSGSRVTPPQEKFCPVKLFSIDRVFRNESLDATHLAEFHQVEGLVAERGLGLAHLLGLLRQFFGKLGTGPPEPPWTPHGPPEPPWTPLNPLSPRTPRVRRDHPPALQTRLQPLHRAQRGDLQLP